DKPRDPQNDGFYFMGKLNLKKGEFATIAIILAAGIYVIGSVLLSEVVKNRSTTSTAGAQQTCNYRALSTVKDENGNIISTGDLKTNFRITKGGQLVREGQSLLQNGYFLVDAPLENDRLLKSAECKAGGCIADVTLVPPSGMQLVRKYCANRGDGGCPEVSSTDWTFRNFNVVCNANYDYGWIVHVNSTSPTPTTFLSPTPSLSSTPVPTTTISACSYRAIAYARYENGQPAGGYDAYFKIQKNATTLREGTHTMSNGVYEVNYIRMSIGDRLMTACESGGCTAQVVLRKQGVDVAQEKIVRKFCDNYGAGGCPDSSSSSPVFSPFNVVCGAYYSYGWLLKNEPSLTATPTPTPSAPLRTSPTLSPSPTPTAMSTPTPTLTTIPTNTPIPLLTSTPPLVCPATGTTCNETYRESCGTNGTKVCYKVAGVCTGTGGGEFCPWTNQSYCDKCSTDTSPTTVPLPPPNSICSVGTGWCSVDTLSKYFTNPTAAQYASIVCNGESGGNPAAPNIKCSLTSGWSFPEYSIGLFQINLVAHCAGGFNYDSDRGLCRMKDPAKVAECRTYYENAINNIQKALQLSKNGTNWGPWNYYRTKCGLP
ncbi:MAG: hypothetical protein Q7S61_02845, partial [bacterium]|nr:hypothetical protein [bacterium]